MVTIHGISQSKLNYIFFYKAHSDTIETNLYKDTILKFDMKIQYDNLKAANINEEVEKAIKNGDFRIVSISGYSVLYPGLEGGYQKNRDGTKSFIALNPKYEKYLNKYSYKIIKGTSDNINLNDPPIQSVAYDYAKKYNTQLLSKMGFNSK